MRNFSVLSQTDRTLYDLPRGGIFCDHLIYGGLNFVCLNCGGFICGALISGALICGGFICGII